MRAACAASTLFALAATPLAAQIPSQAPPPDTLPPVRLDPLVVQALRTPLTLETVPFAVTARTRAEVARGRAGLGLGDALGAVPGVQVENRYNFAVGERIAVRGFGARSQFGVRGVKVYLDGVPATLPDGQTSLGHIDPATLGRVEVIRGPAAALYGNTAGGVIRFESAPPPLVRLAPEVGVTTGSGGLLRLEGAAGGRSGRMEYLATLVRMGYDGYREHSAARTARLNGSVGYAGARDTLRLSFAAADADAENPGALSEAQLAADRFQAFANNVVQRAGKRTREAQAGVSWRRAAAGGAWEGAGYLVSRNVANPIPTAIIDLDRVVGGASVRYGQNRGVLAWTVGAEADRQGDARTNHANEKGERGRLTLDQHETVENLSAYAQASASPLPRLSLLAGARYDHFRFRVDDRLVGPDDPDDSGQRTLHALSPTLGASVQVGGGAHLYANLATSFETPTTTELANRPDGAGGFNPELEPQRALSYEVGAKGSVGGRFGYELAAYRARVENSLVPYEVPGAPGRQFFRNAGSALHRGVEAAATLAPAGWLWLRASYAWTDARFRRYEVAGVEYAGKRVPGVAPHRAEAAVGVEGRGGYAVLEARYSARVPADDANRADAPAYTLADLRVGAERVRLAGIRLAPFAGVQNLFGSDYVAAVAVNAFGGRYFEPGPRRAVYVGGRVGL